MVAGSDRELVCALSCAGRGRGGRPHHLSGIIAQSSEAEQGLGARTPAAATRLSLPRGLCHLGSWVSFLWPP